MKVDICIQKNLPKLALFIIIVLLFSIFFLTSNLMEALLDNQRNVYRMHLYYLKSLESDVSPSEKEESLKQFENLFFSMIDKPFFSELRKADSELDTALRELEGQLVEAEREDDYKPQKIKDVLFYLQNYSEEHLGRQIFTIKMTNYAGAFTLMLMIGLILFFSYRNNLNLKQLEVVLKEKEYLIKEIHHRVKNNLAMIDSFINLQSDKIKDESVVQDLKNQIRAISTVHEKLYMDDNVTHINLDRYIRDLVSEIIYSLGHGNAALEYQIEDINVDPKKAVPIGLIVSELSSNAIKHGFDGQDDFFRITLYSEGETATMAVENNGRPFPQDMDFSSSNSLGLLLVDTLSRQLGGSIELYRTPNTKFVLRFPLAVL